MNFSPVFLYSILNHVNSVQFTTQLNLLSALELVGLNSREPHNLFLIGRPSAAKAFEMFQVVGQLNKNAK